nr:MAG TPA: hypothetical protein [Caudoviricetes sp.]
MITLLTAHSLNHLLGNHYQLGNYLQLKNSDCSHKSHMR